MSSYTYIIQGYPEPISGSYFGVRRHTGDHIRGREANPRLPQASMLVPKLRGASGGELRRGESIEGLYMVLNGSSFGLYTRHIRLM